MRRRAFSLIELITNLVVIGVVAAIALPRYGTALSNYRVSAAARRVASDLVYAQSLAKASSSTYSITFSAGSNSYQLFGGSTISNQLVGGIAAQSAPTSYAVALNSDPYVATIASVSLANATSSISFNGCGLPSTGGTVVLQCGDAQKTLTIDSTTGAVSVQ
jgi:prepilin-type N-terminal cleavage/methylation domain-containing protein